MADDKKMEAKLKLLKDLKKEMLGEMFGDKMEGLKKVTVASDSEEGLEEGLDKAQEIMKKRMDMMGYESEENEDDEKDEYADGGKKIEAMSDEEIEKKFGNLDFGNHPDRDMEDEDDSREGMDYDDEQGEVPGEQDTGPDEYAEGGLELPKERLMDEEAYEDKKTGQYRMDPVDMISDYDDEDAKKMIRKVLKQRNN